jgi:hypothetical protein
MFKRIFLITTFVGAVFVGTFVPAEDAQAWRRWGRPYAARYYYGPNYYARPYRSYYNGGYYGRPYYRSYRSYYAPRYYDPYYGGYYYRSAPRVAFRVGW